MPYGSKVETYIPKTSFVSSQNGSTSSGSRTHSAVPSEDRNYRRSGSNSSVRMKDAVKRQVVQGPWKLVTVTVPKGPRLAYKVRNRYGRLVWARQPIQVYKLVQTRSKVLIKRKKVGMDLNPNPLSYSHWEHIYGGTTSVSSKETTRPANTVTVSGDLWTGIDPWTLNTHIPISVYAGEAISGYTTSLLSQVNTRSLEAFYSAVKNQNVNLAQALAERAQTAKLLADAAVRLFKSLSALKKGRVSRAIELLLPGSPKGIANDFLAYQYGVKPLISDINGIIEEFAKPEKYEFDVKKSKSDKLVRVIEDTDGSYGVLRARVRVIIQSEVTVTYKTRLRVKGISRDFARLGFGNPISLAYELVPWSFVLDWLIPLGDYLNKYDAFSGLQCVFTTKTVFMKETVTIERTFGGQTPFGWTCGYGKTVSQIKRVKVDRTLLSAPPALPAPSFRNPATAGHIANAIALITQLSKSR